MEAMAMFDRSLFSDDAGNSTTSEQTETDTHSFQYTMQVVAIFVIFFLGLSGSLLPPLVHVYRPTFDMNKWVSFRYFNGLAAGIVLGVAFVHSIPDSFGSFAEVAEYEAELAGSTETGDGVTPPAYDYAWPGLIAMMGCMIVYFGEEFVHRKIGKFGVVHGHSHDGHGHEHTSDVEDKHKDKKSKEHTSDDEKKEKEMVVVKVDDEDADEQSQDSQTTAVTHEKALKVMKINYYAELYVLLFGLTFHSLFVGIALGVANNDWGLFAAIVFHQFFEGAALGARVARASFKRQLHIWLLDLVFALAAPIGVAIGIGIQSAIDSGVTYAKVEGSFQALSGGILIYISLVHMMKEELERAEFKSGGPLLWAMYGGFVSGCAFMAIIGIYA